MTAYVLRRGPWGRYLEYIPADRAFGWYAAGEEHATRFTKGAAEGIASWKRAQGEDVRIFVAYNQAKPIDVAPGDLDPEVFCTTHGFPLVMGEYGVPYGGCSECDGASDGTDSTAEERAAEARDQMDDLFRSVK